MRERAQEIGAELKVESEPGRGTCVLVEWQAVA
jgi:signal transduction histidine kinase